MSIAAPTLVGRAILAFPIIATIGVFFLVPVAMMFGLAFLPFDAATLTGDALTLQNFPRFLMDPVHLWTFARTLGIATATALACMVLGYPIAWHLHTVRSGSARLWLTLIVLMPLMISLVVASFAWMLLLGNNGALNAGLMRLGLINQPIALMNTITGVIIVGTFGNISYPVLTIFSALENIPPELARAARIHGASERQVFTRLLLPLSLPGVVAGGLIVFALTMASFVVPFLIGGGRVNVVPLMIYQYTLQLFDWPGAATLGLLLFVLTLACGWLVSAAAQKLMPWERR